MIESEDGFLPDYEPCGFISPGCHMDGSMVSTTVTCRRRAGHDVNPADPRPALEQQAGHHRAKMVVNW